MLVLWIRLKLLTCWAISLVQVKRRLDISILGETKAAEPLILTAKKFRDRIIFFFADMFSLCSNDLKIFTILAAFFFHLLGSPEDMCFPLLDFMSIYTSKI